MKKIVKVMAILLIVGLLFFVGTSISKESSEANNGLDYGSIVTVTAGPECPPPPGYPNNCDP